jgi:hypothetical protein
VMSEPSQLTCTVTVLPLTVVLVTLPQVAGWCDVQEVIARRREDVPYVHFDHLLDESQNRRDQSGSRSASRSCRRQCWCRHYLRRCPGEFPRSRRRYWCSTGLTRFLTSDEPVRGMSMSKDPADPWVKREARLCSATVFLHLAPRTRPSVFIVR